MTDPDSLLAALRAGQVRLTRGRSGDQLILHGSMEELRSTLGPYLARSGALAKADIWRRARDTSATEPVRSVEAPCFEAAAWREADQLFHRDPHWVGADVASSVDLGGGRTLWLFGDTWIDPSGKGRGRGRAWSATAWRFSSALIRPPQKSPFTGAEPPMGVRLPSFRSEALNRSGSGTVCAWVTDWSYSSSGRSAPGRGSELTIHVDQATQRFLAAHTQGFGPADVIMRAAPKLTGPWSAPRMVYRPPKYYRPNIMIYSAKAHPELTGGDLALTYATNTFQFNEHLTDSLIYCPRFVRLTRRR